MRHQARERPNLGQRPLSDVMKRHLASLIDEDWDVIVHHYTDTKDGLQLEVEIRVSPTNIIFKRFIIA